MHNYTQMKQKYGQEVSQTIDSPIMIFEFWEISDIFIALGVILIFGIIFYSWWTMFFLLLLILGLGPWIKKRNNRGIFLHWPYRHLGMSLPSLINPKGKRKYSD